MQTENEFRVRPVVRYALTHYFSDGVKGSCREVGEFPNITAAEEVGVALQALVPSSTLATVEGRTPEYPPKALAAAMALRAEPVMQYTIVEQTVGDIEARVWYAEYAEEADQHRRQLEGHYGREFRVFAREVTDPVALAQRSIERKPTSWPRLQLSAPHTLYPSLYAIGDEVVCKGHRHIVKSVRFVPGKVWYGLHYWSNPDGEVIEYRSEDVYPAAALG